MTRTIQSIVVISMLVSLFSALGACGGAPATNGAGSASPVVSNSPVRR